MQNNPESSTHHHYPLSPESLSNEIKFLIACCQTTPTEEDTAFITACLNTSSQSDDTYPLSLSTITTMASRHGVLPLVYKTLKDLGQTNNTITTHSHYHTLTAKLKAHYQAIVQKNMLMGAELLRIMKLFKENNIEALAFKGPTLAQMAYGDITLRQYSDLDIFVKESQKQKVVSLLLKNGYADILDFIPEQKILWYSNAKEINLYHSEKSIYIDLQWLLFDKNYPLHYHYDTLWEKTSTVKLNNHHISIFSPENLLIYLSIHGAKHLFERIGWIKDIDLFLRTQSINWHQVDRHMKHSDFKRMFLLGLYLSKELFNTPIPEKYIQQCENQPWLRKVNTFIIEDWIEHKNFIYNTIAMLYLFPSTKQKLGYLNKVIFKPSKNEYRFVTLPDRWHWVYYFIRPFLLLKKYLSSS